MAPDRATGDRRLRQLSELQLTSISQSAATTVAGVTSARRSLMPRANGQSRRSVHVSGGVAWAHCCRELDAQYQSSIFTDITDTPLGQVSGRTLMNAHLTWRSPRMIGRAHSRSPISPTGSITSTVELGGAHLYCAGAAGCSARMAGHRAQELLKREINSPLAVPGSTQLALNLGAAAKPSHPSGHRRRPQQHWQRCPQKQTAHRYVQMNERPTQHLPENRPESPHRERPAHRDGTKLRWIRHSSGGVVPWAPSTHRPDIKTSGRNAEPPKPVTPTRAIDGTARQNNSTLTRSP